LDLRLVDPWVISEKIREYEARVNGLDYFPDSSIQVLNVKISPEKVKADVVMQFEPGNPFVKRLGREYDAAFFLAKPSVLPGWLYGIENLTGDRYARVFWRGKMVDCFAASPGEEDRITRAKALADACRTLEEKKTEISIKNIAKFYIDEFAAARANDPETKAGGPGNNRMPHDAVPVPRGGV